MAILFSGNALIRLISTPMEHAVAYLDPGTGSYLLQILIAVVVGFFFVIKMYWKRIVTFIKRLFSRNKSKGPKHDG
jgi:hypothetical protein